MLRVKNFFTEIIKYRLSFLNLSVIALLCLSSCTKLSFPNISAVPFFVPSLTSQQKQQTETKLLLLQKLIPSDSEPSKPENNLPVSVADLLKATPPALNLPRSSFFQNVPFFVFSPKIFTESKQLPLKDRTGLLYFAFIAQNKPLVLALPDHFSSTLLQKIKVALSSEGFAFNPLQIKIFPQLILPCLFIKSSTSIKLCLRNE